MGDFWNCEAGINISIGGFWCVNRQSFFFLKGRLYVSDLHIISLVLNRKLIGQLSKI